MERKKDYHIQYGIGKCKYVVSFHDGIQKHKDGSNFYDCRIFKNKIRLSEFEVKLVKDGYTFKRGGKRCIKKT